ncbi:hypothetical protein H0H92_002273, partial [Tricholoma furcatifolium]
MSRCPRRCTTCADEARVERRQQVRERAAVRACRAGPPPPVDLDLLDPPPLAFLRASRSGDMSGTADLEPEEFQGVLDPQFPDEAIEEGDRILAAIPPSPQPETMIRASQTTSQRLAEAFTSNDPPKSFRDAVPDYLHDFEDV